MAQDKQCPAMAASSLHLLGGVQSLLLHSSGAVHRRCILRDSGGQSGGKWVHWCFSCLLQAELCKPLQRHYGTRQFCLLWRLELISQECERSKGSIDSARHGCICSVHLSEPNLSSRLEQMEERADERTAAVLPGAKKRRLQGDLRASSSAKRGSRHVEREF